MFIKQHWNDYCNYFDLERKRGGIERVGQREDDFSDH